MWLLIISLFFLSFFKSFFFKVQSLLCELQREKGIRIQFLVEELTLRAYEVIEYCKIYIYFFFLGGDDCFQLMHTYNVENRCVQFKQWVLN